MNYSKDLSSLFFNDKPEFLYTRMSIVNSDKSLHEYKFIRRTIVKMLIDKNFTVNTDVIPFIKSYPSIKCV